MQDPNERHPNAPPMADRRSFARKRADALLYIGLGDENGGIILNLGEDGLEFHAAMGLRQSNFPKIRFQLPLSGQWTEAAGQVAWANETGNTAGLKFTSLPEEARAEIRDWMAGHARSTESRIGGKEPQAKPWTVPSLGLPSQTIVTEERGAESSSVRQLSSAGESAPDEKEEPQAFFAEDKPEEEPRETGAVEAVAIFPSETPAAETPVATYETTATDEEELVAAAAAVQESISRQGKEPTADGEKEKTLPAATPATSEPFTRSFEWQRAKWEEPRKPSSGWGAWAILIVAVTTSFAAGWAIGNGWLNKWMRNGEQVLEVKAGEVTPTAGEKTEATPKNHTSPEVTTPTPSTSPSARMESNAKSAPAKVTSEAATGATRVAATPNANTPEGAATSAIAGGSESEDLPEEPISASDTIAMSIARSVEIPTANAALHEPPPRIQAGEVTSHAEPEYPAETIEQQVEGTVRLLVTIGRNGEIQEIEPMGGPPALLGPSVAAVQKWRFNPTYLNGKTVRVRAVVKIVFRLPDAGTSPANP
ncbi:MAG TPA: energy transducer TonB [Candidatus Acidoferrum sp.]|nr:energy transducer TonB [Candidatus Acidoferrum sp.]